MHSQKHFLHLDHWIENPKSMTCNEHIWFVVRLRIGPITASLTDWQIYNWRTITTSSSKTRTYAPLDSQSRNINIFCLWRSIHRKHAPTYKGHMPLTSIHQFGSIKYQLDLFHAHVLRYQYKPRNNELRIIQWL